MAICVCLLHGQSLSAQADQRQEEKVYNFVDEMPSFNGDMNDYMSRALHFPDSARVKNEQGRSIVRFVVTRTGAIDSVSLGRSSGSKWLDDEALRFVSTMPNWRPGKIHDTPVNTFFALPVTFSLEDPTPVPVPAPSPFQQNDQVVSCTTDPNDTTIYVEVNRAAEFLFDVRGFLRQSLIFPQAAGQLGNGGKVEHRVVIDQRGYFKTVELSKSSGNPWLDRAADDALRTLLNLNKSRNPPCMPAIRDGKCVRSAIIIPTNFLTPGLENTESGLSRSYRYR